LNSIELKCTQNIKLYHFVHTILSGYHFVQYHFVRIPFVRYHFVRSVVTALHHTEVVTYFICNVLTTISIGSSRGFARPLLGVM